MKRLISIFALTATVAIAASTAVAGPNLAFSESSFDFGKVPQNATVSHAFWIHSTGDDTLRITKIVPGCGCTKAPVNDSVLAPGDSTKLEILFETRRYAGFVTKKPYIETNGPAERNILTIDTHILTVPDSLHPIFITPPRLDVSQFTETPRRKATFVLENRSDKDYNLKLIDFPKDYYTVKLPSKVKAGQTAEGEIEVVEDRIEEGFERSFTFSIDDEKSSRYSLPVKRMYRVKTTSASGS